jgi:ribosome biogenesis GTPase
LVVKVQQPDQEVRAHDGRGRHTTTHRQLFTRLEGGAIIDSPGLRGLELWNPSEGSKSNFDDIEDLAAQCRFRDCRHDSEPGCEVRAAVERGDLDAVRFASYVKLGRASQRSPR